MPSPHARPISSAAGFLRLLHGRPHPPVFQRPPLYAFGHGLSYSRTRYGKLTAATPKVTPTGTVEFKTTIANVSGPQDDEVVQVCARELSDRPNRPLRQLVAFRRVSLAPGAHTVVDLSIPTSELRHWDDASGASRVDPCAYAFDVGPASDQPELSTTVTVAP